MDRLRLSSRPRSARLMEQFTARNEGVPGSSPGVGLGKRAAIGRFLSVASEAGWEPDLLWKRFGSACCAGPHSAGPRWALPASRSPSEGLPLEADL